MPYRGEMPLRRRIIIRLSPEILTYLRASPFNAIQEVKFFRIILGSAAICWIFWDLIAVKRARTSPDPFNPGNIFKHSPHAPL